MIALFVYSPGLDSHLTGKAGFEAENGEGEVAMAVEKEKAAEVENVVRLGVGEGVEGRKSGEKGEGVEGGLGGEGSAGWDIGDGDADGEG
jgi:hypothetical protein